MMPRTTKELKFDKNGLIPAIVQEKATGRVLMLAYMNKEALTRTINSGTSWFFSRSRNKLWNKGEVSGNTQKVLDIRMDCDRDTLLLLVEQRGVPCHTGNETCFYRNIEGEKCDVKPDESYETKNVGPGIADFLKGLYLLIEERDKNPKEGSYTNYLLNSGIDKILKKVGEEAAEVLIGAKNSGKDETIYEIADLLYHITVLMYYKGIDYDEIFDELSVR